MVFTVLKIPLIKFNFVKNLFSGLMSSTAQPTSITSPSSSQPPTSVVGVTSSPFYNHNNQQFQPIQRQPLISNGGAVAKVFDVSKVNATATHIELEQQSNCNFTSILNMSCRGRAEAFARSLQSRLKTLGSQVSIKTVAN